MILTVRCAYNSLRFETFSALLSSSDIVFLSPLLDCAVVIFKEHMRDDTGKCGAHMYHLGMRFRISSVSRLIPLVTLSPVATATATAAVAATVAAATKAAATTAAATTAPPADKEWLQGGKHELVMIDDSFMLPAFEPSTAIDPPVIGFGKYLNQKIQLSLEGSEVHRNSNPLHQAAVFDLLRAASAVFDALNISYFLSHGTLLGAFRHGDMLKWDYDIDST